MCIWGGIDENVDLNDNWVETRSLYSNHEVTFRIDDFLCSSSEMGLSPEVPMLIGRHIALIQAMSSSIKRPKLASQRDLFQRLDNGESITRHESQI
jgi:hypothetical protein